MMAYVEACGSVLLELAPWLLLGVAAAMLLHRILPRGFAERRLTGRGSVVRAVLLGVPMPLCSCGVLPTGLGLFRSGAGRGATVGFITSTPQTGVDSIFVSASMLGWPFALFKLASAGVSGVVAGWLTDRVDRRPSAGTSSPGTTGTRPSWKQSVAHGIDILRMVLPWVAVGVLVSALLDVWVPPSWWAESQRLGLWASMGLALLLSLPMYVCATGSVPIAATLVSHGFPGGAALVFLMAGPATNVGTLGALWRELGGRAAAVYLATLVAVSLGAGALFSTLLPVGSEAPTMDHTGPVGWLSAAVLLGFAAWEGVDRLRGLLRRKGAASGQEFQVQGLTCGGCVRKLERHVGAVPGVAGTEVDRERGWARVSGRFDADAVIRAIEDAGFDGRRAH
ncbi:MAG TPA: permease [Myxococcales bacterium LLY-WYZ-16_1]|nr:permease [Myxococcales bacterium LLY-WYZ-16_1]